MKSQLIQFVTFVNKIDRSHIQLAYLVFTLAAMFVMQKPADGGVGPS
jgi:hypothetical protein